MYLLVNPIGTHRHMLLETFQDVTRLSMKHYKSGTKFQFSILKPGHPGKYDLVLEYFRESITGSEFLKGYITVNEENHKLVGCGDLSGLMITMFTPPTTKKKVDIIEFFENADLANGYIPKDNVPPSILDDFDELTRELDKMLLKPTNTNTSTGLNS